jgi:fatty acid desaturase
MSTPLLRERADGRQLLIVGIYFALLAAMYFVPACRNLPCLALACLFSFFTMTVNHNILHLGIFRSRTLNRAFRMVLSFAALFPVSSVIPSHNLVHHQFGDGEQLDWADPSHVRFKWNLLNLIHFPNVVGPITFAGINRWARVEGRGDYRKQSRNESIFAFGLTAALMANDFWVTLFFILIPQLCGARWFLRINLIQHDGADTKSEWNHSRNFTGRLLNFFMVNAGYHTIHHNRAGLHWAALPKAHAAEVAARIDPSLVEPSMAGYLLRTYVFRLSRPAAHDVALAERAQSAIALPSLQERTAQAEIASASV